MIGGLSEGSVPVTLISIVPLGHNRLQIIVYALKFAYILHELLLKMLV